MFPIMPYGGMFLYYVRLDFFVIVFVICKFISVMYVLW